MQSNSSGAKCFQICVVMDKMIKIVSQVQQDQKKLSSQDEPRANQPNTGFFDVFKNLCGNFEIKLVSLTHVLEDE